MLRRRYLVGLAVLVITMPVLAQENVTLEWKFEKGKTFYQDMSTETKQTIKVMGMDITQNQKQTFIFSWTPLEQDKDKNWVIQQKIEAVKMDIEIGGNKITYDSSKDTGAGNPLADFFKTLVGSEFKLTISPEMKVTKIEGKDEFLKKLIQQNQQMQPLLQQILNDESLKQMADPAFGVIPGKPVKKGDNWTRDTKLDMGPIGKFETSYKYTYDGKEGKLDKIKVETSVKYIPPGDNTAGGLPFKIKAGDFKTSKGTGTILFDNEKHRLDSSDITLDLAGKLTIEIGGMSSDVDLTQTQKTTIKTSDTNPASAAPAKK